jgi:hypothetical protein
MKKIILLLFVIFSSWQINAQVLNQNAGWPNAAWTITGTYSVAPGAFEFNPTTTANFAYDDDDAGNPSDDQIAAESPVIDLTAAHTAGEQKVRVSALHLYRTLPNDVLRFEYWNADSSTWVVWGSNLPGNNTIVTDNFCTGTKTLIASTDLDIAAFTPTQLSGFKYRIYYNDNLVGGAWNWGFCFDSPTIISVPTPCLTGFNFPTAIITPATCDGFTPNLVSNFSSAGDYFNVAVTSGQTYKFTSSVATDFFTISTDNGVTSSASGTQPLTWVSTITGTARVHINTNITCGTQDTDRITNIICGTACLTGGLFPFATYTPNTCDGTTVNQISPGSWAGEYSNVQVFSTNTYTFSSSVVTDYLTVASADGLTPLAVGTASVTYTPLIDGVIRVYIHTNSTCGTQNVDRIKSVVCTTTATIPGCASNPSPADGSLTVPAFTTFDVTWNSPTTGGVATSYDLYSGNSIATLAFEGNFLTNSILAVGPIGAYSTTVYWQIIPRNGAGAAIGCSVWSFTTIPQPTDLPDFANLQWPPTINISQGGSDTVYGQVYEAGLTDVVPNVVGQAPGIQAWVGISPLGANTDPNTWTNWIPATWNSGHVSNNDEYQATIGAALLPGTYYYATRYALNGGAYVYGGLNNGFWNAATNPSGVLTVNPPPAPANDDCTAPIALTPGGVFGDFDIDSTNLGATLSAQTPNPTCGTTNFTTSGKDVWYSVIVPASGSITIETSATAVGGLGMDTVVQVYSGDCNTLVAIGCNDDDFGTFSRLSLTGQTPGATLLIRMFGWNGASGSFGISAYDASLGNNTFDNANFSYYPNPVKNTLNLSYNQEISNVEIFNLLGQKVNSNVINANQAQVDMSNLSNGVYLVKVISNNQSKTIRVIKE